MKRKQMEENIYLFIPNLIGYARVIFAIISFWYMPTNPAVAGICYVLSGGLDAFDGLAARKFNQGTCYGAVLDMVTDRCSTLCLILVLGYFYPSWLFVFQLLVALDITSHWVQMYSSLIQGESSHKVTDLSANPIMRLYYTRPVLFTFCSGNELFFASLYLAHFSSGFIVPLPFGYEVGCWVLLAIICFPISFLKQVVSVVQMVVAFKNIAALDVVERAKQTRDHS